MPNNNALLIIERIDPIYADFTISQKVCRGATGDAGEGV
jgi:hypothetical protein